MTANKHDAACGVGDRQARAPVFVSGTTCGEGPTGAFAAKPMRDSGSVHDAHLLVLVGRALSSIARATRSALLGPSLPTMTTAISFAVSVGFHRSPPP